MNLAAIIPLYNREEYLGAYLEMLLSHNVDCFVNLSTVPWNKGGNEEDEEPDRSELILNKFFPGVHVTKGIFNHHKDSLRYDNRFIKKYDRVLTMDCDMYLTKEDFAKMEEFLKDDVDVFRVNFENMIQEYYFDYRYGKPAIPGGVPPIIAVRPGITLDTITMASGGYDKIWDINGPKIHHFRWAKRNGSGKHRCNEPTSNFHDYTPAPQEIIDLLLKWRKILESI